MSMDTIFFLGLAGLSGYWLSLYVETVRESRALAAERRAKGLK